MEGQGQLFVHLQILGLPRTQVRVDDPYMFAELSKNIILIFLLHASILVTLSRGCFCSPACMWQCLEMFQAVAGCKRRGCCWHLMNRSQNCCYACYRAQAFLCNNVSAAWGFSVLVYHLHCSQCPVVFTLRGTAPCCPQENCCVHASEFQSCYAKPHKLGASVTDICLLPIWSLEV